MSALLFAGRALELVVCASAVAVLARARKRRRALASGVDDASEAHAASRARPSGVRPDMTAVDPAAMLERLLEDARAALGADEAVFWQRSADRESLFRVAASPRSAGADAEAVKPVVAWAAEQGMPHIGDGDDLAVAPIAGGSISGALSLRRSGGFGGDRDAARQWLARYADRVGELAGLLQTHEAHVRSRMQRELLVTAATAFQQSRSAQALGNVICAMAAQLAEADSAALVRWFGDSETGIVQSVWPAESGGVGQPVTAGSLASDACAGDLRAVWEDATRFDGSTPIFGTGEPAQRVGSLAIVPVGGGRSVIGAIVVLGAAPRVVRGEDLPTLRLLASMALVSLETQWGIEAVELQARTDQLTGLANRRAFDDAFKAALVQAERYGQHLSLIVVDIDRFKSVNDTLGHAGGDAVLKAVAATLQRHVRTSDLCARFGGEEIAILLSNTPQKGAAELAERLRIEIERRPVRIGGREQAVTASFGVASLQESVGADDDLFAAADRALYRAKAEGRNCVRSAMLLGGRING